MAVYKMVYILRQTAIQHGMFLFKQNSEVVALQQRDGARK